MAAAAYAIGALGLLPLLARARSGGDDWLGSAGAGSYGSAAGYADSPGAPLPWTQGTGAPITRPVKAWMPDAAPWGVWKQGAAIRQGWAGRSPPDASAGWPGPPPLAPLNPPHAYAALGDTGHAIGAPPFSSSPGVYFRPPPLGGGAGGGIGGGIGGNAPSTPGGVWFVPKPGGSTGTPGTGNGGSGGGGGPWIIVPDVDLPGGWPSDGSPDPDGGQGEPGIPGSGGGVPGGDGPAEPTVPVVPVVPMEPDHGLGGLVQGGIAPVPDSPGLWLALVGLTFMACWRRRRQAVSTAAVCPTSDAASEWGMADDTCRSRRFE